MLTSQDEERVVQCARRLAAISTSSTQLMAQTLGRLACHEYINPQALNLLFQWAHAVVRVQAIEVLTKTGALGREGAMYRVDQEMAGAVRLALLAIAPYVTSPIIGYPTVYVTPPDLLPVLSGDIGELRRLLIELIGSARMSVRIVTPFFSEIAFREILAPLERPDVRASLSLYLSLHPSERSKGRALLQGIIERFPDRDIVVYLNVWSREEAPALPHAKLLLCDGVVGYLGSANISLHGLHEQFEVGVRLDAHSVRALEQTLDALVQHGMYTRWYP